jgi:hypothetical protein
MPLPSSSQSRDVLYEIRMSCESKVIEQQTRTGIDRDRVLK